MNIHATLAASLQHQETASPDDWEATFRQMALFDLAADMELGFFLSYYRNFAIPSIAATLHTNAEIQQRPMKRSYDTAIVIYELIATGLDSDRGKEMTALLNRVHRNVPGSKDDFLYVLLTLLVVPIRWTQRRAWRQPTTAELAAASRFFTELGARMNITAMPATYADAEEFFDRYSSWTPPSRFSRAGCRHRCARWRSKSSAQCSTTTDSPPRSASPTRPALPQQPSRQDLPSATPSTAGDR